MVAVLGEAERVVDVDVDSAVVGAGVAGRFAPRDEATRHMWRRSYVPVRGPLGLVCIQGVYDAVEAVVKVEVEPEVEVGADPERCLRQEAAVQDSGVLSLH